MNQDKTAITISDWGLLDYAQALSRQMELLAMRLDGQTGDHLVLVEHPATVTLGRRGSSADLLLDEALFAARGITLERIKRGGMATAHEPGQLVVYPIVALKKKDIRWYADGVLGAVIDLLADYGVQGVLKPGEPGVWVAGKKICSFGIALKKWISCHGAAVNLNNSLETFTTIIPCGHQAEVVTSLSAELGRPVDMIEAKRLYVQHFCERFSYFPKKL